MLHAQHRNTIPTGVKYRTLAKAPGGYTCPMSIPWTEALPFPPLDTPVLVTVARGGLDGATEVVLSEYRGTCRVEGEFVERWAGIPYSDLVLAWILPLSLSAFTYG